MMPALLLSRTPAVANPFMQPAVVAAAATAVQPGSVSEEDVERDVYKLIAKTVLDRITRRETARIDKQRLQFL